MSEVTTVFQKGSQVKYVHHSLLEENMEERTKKFETINDPTLQEKVEAIHQVFETFFASMKDMVKDPSVENLEKVRDMVFDNAERQFEFGSVLSRIINQSHSDDDFEVEEEDADFDWADDQEMFVLLEEALELLKSSAELLARMKKYRKHILLELDEYGELPRALSGLHDALLERLEKLADVRNDF